jgi:diacylglycerol kinase
MTKSNNNGFSLRDRIRSFANAFSGIGMMWRSEHNFRVHLLVFLLAVIAGLLLKISAGEWVMIFIVSAMVLTAECFNSAIETLSDEVSAEYSERIKKVKDIAAAGVLISAIAAAITGLLIFVPGIIKLIRSI